jgi:hypothetical protein
MTNDPTPRTSAPTDNAAIGPSGVADMVVGEAADQDWSEPNLAVAALIRCVARPPEQSDADIDRMFTRAMAGGRCPVSPDRMIKINQIALAHHHQFPSLVGTDISNRTVRPGPD